MVRTAGVLVVLAIGAAVLAGSTAAAQSQAPVAEPNRLAEPFMELAARVDGPIAETTEWLRSTPPP